MVEIVREDSVRSGDSCVAGTRITVFDLKRRVIDEGEDPHVVAGEYDIDLSDRFGALAYYYEHREELRARERAVAETRREGEQRTRELLAPESEIRREGAD